MNSLMYSEIYSEIDEDDFKSIRHDFEDESMYDLYLSSINAENNNDSIYDLYVSSTNVSSTNKETNTNREDFDLYVTDKIEIVKEYVSIGTNTEIKEGMFSRLIRYFKKRISKKNELKTKL